MLKAFFEAVLPPHGHYCLFLGATKAHRWAETIDELVALTEAQGTAQGVYFATSSFTDPTTRKQDNVALLKALRLDIDAGAAKFERDPDGTYPSQRDALIAFAAFAKTTTTPSLIVSSGAGLHIYYVLREAVAPAEWIPLAEALKAQCKELGLKADPSVTCDTARVLRPPGTLHKSGDAVRVLKDTGRTFDVETLSTAFPLKVKPKYDTSINAEALEGVVIGPPKSINKVIEKCAAVAHVRETRGNVPEPYWRAMLGIVKFTVEGNEAAHPMSDGYAGYDFQETEKKLERWATGPTTCAEFSKHTKACETCPHNGKIRSPISLGAMSVQQIEQLPPEKQPPPPAVAAPTGDPWDGKLPAGYAVKKGQLVAQHKIEKENQDGEVIPTIVEVAFSRTVFWLEDWAFDETESLVRICHIDSMDKSVKGPTRFPASTIAVPQDMRKFLAGAGIFVGSHQQAEKLMDKYLKDSMDRIRDISRRVRIKDRLGVFVDGDALTVHHGEHVIGMGSLETGLVDGTLASVAGNYPLPLPKTGSGKYGVEVWEDVIKPRAKLHCDFMRRHYDKPGLEKFQLAAMLSLASPLMPFTMGSWGGGTALPANSLTVSLYSAEGGRGKTTLMQCVALAYGNPEALTKGKDKDSATKNAVIKGLSLLGTLPSFMDEMGNLPAPDVASIVTAVANGAAKQTLSKNREMREDPPWSLVNLLSTNKSLRDLAAVANSESDASQYRMIELNVDGLEFDKASQDLFRAEYAVIRSQVAGALGAVIHRRMSILGLSGINAMMAKAMELVSAKTAWDQKARFFTRTLAAALVLCTILRKEGLELFPPTTVLLEMIKAEATAAQFVKDNVMPLDGVSLLGRALADLRPHTLITDGWTNRSVERNKEDRILNEGNPPSTVKVRHVVSMDTAFVDVAALRTWCQENKVSLEVIRRAGIERGVLMQHVRRSGQATFVVQRDLWRGLASATNSQVSSWQVNTRALNSIVQGEDAPSNIVPLHPSQPTTKANNA